MLDQGKQRDEQAEPDDIYDREDQEFESIYFIWVCRSREKRFEIVEDQGSKADDIQHHYTDE